MISGLISRLVILVFGTLYPAYASYKAVKTKNVKEYVKWMMYWIVFAFFTTIETFADIFVAWLPFYYELKIVFVIWLLSPATKGASILYRKFVHPQLNKREKEIDTYLTKVSDQGYSALVTLGSRGFNYATNVVVNTAIKGQSKLADQLKKSYSLNDLDGDENMEFRPSGEDIEEEDETDNRIIEERYQREMMERDEDEERKIKREVIEVSDDESPKKVTKKHATAQKEQKKKSTLTTKSTASSGSSAGMSLSTRTTPPVSKTSTGSGGAAKTSGGIGASAAAGARGTKGGLGLPSSSSSGGGVGGSGQSWRLRSTYSSSAWK